MNSDTTLAPIQPGEPPMKQIVVWDGFKAEAEKLKATAESLTVTNVSQIAEMKLARETRLTIKNLRVTITKRHKDLKEDALRECNRLDSAKRELLAILEPLEERLQLQEDFAVREVERLTAEKREARTECIQRYLSGPLAVDLGTLTDVAFKALLEDTKAAYEARVERERKEQETREAAAKREREEMEAQRQENIRLRKERAEVEARAAQDRAAAKAEQDRLEREAAAERRAAQERADIEAARVRAEQELAAEKARAEREALEAEARKEREAREKAEAELAAQKAKETVVVGKPPVQALELKSPDGDPRLGLPSASNAEADSLCPGRHLAQQGLPERKSEDATFGDRVHAAMAGTLDPNTLTVEEYVVYENAREVENHVLNQWLDVIIEAGENGQSSHLIEKRLWLGDDLKVPVSSGQCDRAWIVGTHALIEDLKSLWGDITESPSNLQLRDLAVLLRENHPQVEEITVFINQPRVTRNPETTKYQLEHLAQARAETIERVARSSTPGQPRTPGEKQCKYCRANGNCPALHSEGAMAEFVSRMGAVENANPKALKETAGRAAGLLPGDQLASYLDRIPLAKIAIAALESEAKRRLSEAPTAVPGYQMGKSRVLRPITAPAVVYERFEALGGTSKMFLSIVEVGKGKLSEFVGAITQEKGKKLEARMDALLEGCVTEKVCEPPLEKVD